MALRAISLITTFFKKNWKRLVVLVIYSALLYAFVFFISYISDPEKATREFGRRHGVWVNMVLYICEVTVTYYILIFCVIIPFIRKGDRWHALLITFLLFLAKLGIGYWEFVNVQIEAQGKAFTPSKGVIPENSVYWFLLWSNIVFLFDLVVSFSAAFMIEWMRKSRQQIILEKQKAVAELSALKHQINPHFLFNSLSFIYGKTVKLDEDVAQSVLILADIMRYALGKEEDRNGKVKISREITHMKNVIEINQRRHNYQLNILYEEDVLYPSATIIPLVLITLVENAFKHGNLHDKNSPLIIKLCTSEEQLSFYIKNKKGQGIKELSNGIGLKNIEQQLDLVYGDEHTFILEDTYENFSVLLKIPLTS
ncbi:histidine kinase [Olivibacter sp. SDN3]|uniref:sensor histidine kinase n=1 Tax=Olivibacter sp. SDN3 TaxID=2764720 RepID=UPI001651172C|nr:histidine kinase [Olivibacter sp. SDN3]QNL48621.1 histidine kinase [Olivibacter sp. SDN3]